MNFKFFSSSNFTNQLNIGLKTKLQIFILLITLITIIPILIYFHVKSSNAMINLSRNQLVSLRKIAKTRLGNYFQDSINSTERLSHDRLIEGMFIAFEGSFYADGFTTGKDQEIFTTAYQELDNKYGTRIKTTIKELNLSNLSLINMDGQIIYTSTVNKHHKILGKDLTNGSLAKTPLGKCFQNANKSKDNTQVFFANYSYYKHTNTVDAYLCTKQLAEFDHLSEGISTGEYLGVIALKIDYIFINSILTDRTGMGETGQLYLVGEDGKLRSDLFVNKEKFNVLNSFKNNIVISTASFANAINNKTGVHVITGPNGNNVDSAYTTLKVFGKNWALIGEKQTQETMKPIYLILKQVIINASIIIFIIMLIVYFFARSIVNPILKISSILNKSSSNLNEASEELSDASNKLSASSNQQAAATQESVAAMQEMASMINQTAEFSHKSKEISNTVRDMTNNGAKIMDNMVDSMENINKENENMRDMVEVIKDISKKTNVINDIVFKTQLLSFNASIEAARAGQHGKGFAVVAEEVGNLANMSGNAAREIHTLLEESQKKVNDTVKSTEKTVKHGQEVTDKAQAIFRQISDNITLINEQIQRIVEATSEQEKGVQQTESALKQLDDAASGNSEIAVKAQNNSSQLQKSQGELNVIITQLNQIMLGTTKVNIKKVKINKSEETVEIEEVDPQILDGIIAQKDSLSDEDFEKMEE